MPAMLMGAIAGIVCAIACSKIKSLFGYDDALDAFGVHGVGGTLGAILTGIFATRAAWDLNNHETMGLLEGGSALKGQLVAVAVTWVFSIVATLIILKIVDVIVGIRVTPEEEVLGLDVTQHGEEGYIFV
jgi:Amt family ammonium transporter